jgi:hypothetical protein
MEKDAHFQSLPSHVLQVPEESGPPSGSPNRALKERDAPFPELYLIYTSEPPVNETHRFPNGAPMERDARFQSLLFHIP